eukprot:4569661-Pleurochrysis_carterae.AAC.1
MAIVLLKKCSHIALDSRRKRPGKGDLRGSIRPTRPERIKAHAYCRCIHASALWWVAGYFLREDTCIPTYGSARQRVARTILYRARTMSPGSLSGGVVLPTQHPQGCGRSFVRLGACLTAEHVRGADAIPRDHGHVGSVYSLVKPRGNDRERAQSH